MLKIGVGLSILVVLGACNTSTQKNDSSLMHKVDSALELARQQSVLMAENLLQKPNTFPRSINKNGELVTSDAEWWCSGFFPGELWYLYENFNDTLLKHYAQIYTNRIQAEKPRKWDHDVGFIIFNSYGNGYRLTGDTAYYKIILQGAYSLSSRFRSPIGCIRSWDYASWNKQWQYPVIIDNMMNLEILMWAGQEFNQPNLVKVAEIHAKTTMRNHYRDDYSSYHVVSYDTNTFDPELKQTSQGYSDESEWARGQSWGLYGYTMMFRETGDSTYLNQATHIADFLIHHTNLPADKIPFWDFNDPDIPNALRDASAGAIMCSALLELHQYVNEPKASEYLKVAEKQLEVLCGEEYLAKVGENQNFILKHSVGHMPNQNEVDVPLSYADYYFVEALVRYKKLKK
jgi:hypothetical protein